MGSYLRILRVDGMSPLLLAATLARLPIGINGLALVLLLQQERGSFGLAGLASGALALGTGVGAPLMARLVDRAGDAVLGLLAALHAAALVTLLLLAADAPAAFVVGLAGFAGAVAPPVSSLLRALYPRMLRGRPELIQGAFALDSVLTELIFIAGPALTAAIAVLVSPAAALALAAGAVAIGTFAFLAVRRSGAPDTRERDAAPAGLLGALRAPGVRTLVLTMVPVGLAFGILEITLAAFAADEGRPELAGVLLTMWALASAVGGLVYGARPRRGSASDTHLRVAVLLPIGLVPLVLATSPVTMAVLVLPAGIFIAPLLATRNELAGLVAPPGTTTEAYTWPLTAIVAGIAGGAALAGAIVDAGGWRTAALAAVACAAAGSILSVTRRGTLVRPEPAVP